MWLGCADYLLDEWPRFFMIALILCTVFWVKFVPGYGIYRIIFRPSVYSSSACTDYTVVCCLWRLGKTENTFCATDKHCGSQKWTLISVLLFQDGIFFMLALNGSSTRVEFLFLKKTIEYRHYRASQKWDTKLLMGSMKIPLYIIEMFILIMYDKLVHISQYNVIWF